MPNQAGCRSVLSQSDHCVPASIGSGCLQESHVLQLVVPNVFSEGFSILGNRFECDDATTAPYLFGKRKRHVADVRADVVNGVAGTDILTDNFLQMGFG